MTKKELKEIQKMLKDVEKEHQDAETDDEKGFVRGIKFVREELLPAFQEVEN